MIRIILSIFLSSFTVSNFAMQRITVNGTDLKKILKQGQVLSYKNDDNHIAFTMKNGVIDLGSVSLSDTDIKNIRQDYEALNAHKAELSRVISGEITKLVSGGPIRTNNAYIMGGEYVMSDTVSQIDMKNTILESKKIDISCSKFSALQCFVIVANTLTIKSKAPNSLIKAIHFIFSPTVSDFVYIEGTINFENNEVGAPFFVMGAQDMEIEFAPEVFE